MAQLHAIHHEHTRLAEALRGLREDVRLIRDEGIVDPLFFGAVRRFIDDVALPHLRDEEANVFPRAAALGLAPEILEILRRDHEELRFLARRARLSGLAPADGTNPGAQALPHDAAAVVERFVIAFDDHARREEAIFRELSLEPAPAAT